MVKNSEL